MTRVHDWRAAALACGVFLAVPAGSGSAWAASQGAPASAAAERKAALNSVQALDYATLSGGAIIIKLIFKEEVKEPPRFFASYHPRVQIVLDFADTASGIRSDPTEVGQRGLRSLQVVQNGNRTRLIINLMSPAIHEIERSGKEVLVTLRRPSG